ncbi:hypothetical protein Taro_017376 [Colocasia esculenta]|uniref:Uncharacterized protein n=1 Tax=Colocasia esculenta TaxID=4460 RepID=A0A843UZ81_COLES|nr:hypothetical protein [Colocasia esculenta]
MSIESKKNSCKNVYEKLGHHRGAPKIFINHGNMDVRTPKYLGCLNTLHPNPRDEFTTFWGRVEELLGAGELWIYHKKDIFFPRSSAATCTNRPLEADQRRRPRT